MISQHILIKDSPFQSSQKRFCIPLLDSLILKLLSSPLSLVCSNSSTQTLMFYWLTQIETLFPSLSFDCVGILLLGDNQWERQACRLGWGNWVLLGTDEWVPILLPTPIFLWVVGNMEIDSWAFLSNNSGDALLAVGSKQGQTDMLSHKSVLAMSRVWKVAYAQRNIMSVEQRVTCGTTGWLIWGPSLCVYS